MDFDIFLSHAAADAPLVDKAKAHLESLGYTVYVDRADDPQLDRAHVTRATAERLRKRMRQCRALVFAVTRSSPMSKWIPWELGYFDGYAGSVFVYPLDQEVARYGTGQEYLDLYTRLDPDNLSKDLQRNVMPIREQIFRPADYAATHDLGDRVTKHAPQLIFDPSMALQWQADLCQAWMRLFMPWLSDWPGSVRK